MKEEYNYTLTVPLSDIDAAIKFLNKARKENPQMRLSRKPDTKKSGRFYLSFPFSGSRTDLRFHKWFTSQHLETWELFGPNYGVWGLS